MVQFYFEEIVGEEFYGDFGQLATMYEQCTFVDCDFTGSDFSKITFVDCAFENCNLSNVTVQGTVLNDCRFRRSKLIGIHFSEAAQETLELLFDDCRIDSVVFDNVVLQKIKMGKSELVRSEIHWADFSGADFSECDLRETRFYNCNLENADFRNASNIHFDIRENRISGATFSIECAPELLESFGIFFE